MLLGCIGDDFTGSSDIGNTLSKAGMRVTQYNGVPLEDADPDVEAGVISLKSRSIPVDDAVSQSLAAARWLLRQGCEQLYFKYCSTFDSTPQGNIGPVSGALAQLVGEDKIIMCPAFPDTGRTVYQGHLFVDDVPLSESGMKDHPLTPMTNSDLRQWLALQTGWQVEHLRLQDIHKGTDHVSAQIARFSKSMIIADTVANEDFRTIAAAVADRKLITGASGLARNLPDNYRMGGKLGSSTTPWQGADGHAALLCGSCSSMSRRQVAHYSKHGPSKSITAFDIIEGNITAPAIAEWIMQQAEPPLVYSSGDPEQVQKAQNELGQERAAAAIEGFFGALAVALTEQGLQKIVSAGGETSGAIVTALDIKSMSIGPEIAPGVPALKVDGTDLMIVLKSGNFGAETFFDDALQTLNG